MVESSGPTESNETYHEKQLARDLNLFDITMIGVGAMIGAGIFVLAGEAAGVAGPALILSFALNGLITIFTAMVYAELGSAIPKAGGGFHWVQIGLPGANAFIAGWMSWFAHAVAGALYAIGFGAFLFELLRLLGVSMEWVQIVNVPLQWVGLQLTALEAFKKGGGVLVVLVFAQINFQGSSETGTAENVVTVAKIAVILLFILAGIKFMFFPDALFTVEGAEGGMKFSQLKPFFPDETGWIGILSACGITFVAFEGYEIIVQSGEEAKEPRKNIPKAVFWSLTIVVPIYMMVAFVLVGATNSEMLLQALKQIGKDTTGLTADMPAWKLLREAGELGLARAAGQFLPYGAFLVLLGGLFSTMSALNATTFSSTRVSFAMGREHYLPEQFGSIHNEHQTPHVALFWTTLLMLFMVLFFPITRVAAAADIMFLLLFLQVNTAVMTIREKYGDRLAYGYLMPFYPVVPVIGIVTKLGLAVFMFDHYLSAWVYAIAWLLAGFLVYHLYAREKARETEVPDIAYEEKPKSTRPGSVLLPLRGGSPSRQVLHMSASIADRQQCELILFSMAVIPRQLPAGSSEQATEYHRHLLRKNKETLGVRYDVPLHPLIRIGHNWSEGVVQTTRDMDVEYIVMEWGRGGDEEEVFTEEIRDILLESNCHTILLKHRPYESPPGNLLIPLKNANDSALAIGVGSILISEQNENGTMTLLHLSETPQTTAEKEQLKQNVRELKGPSFSETSAFPERLKFDFGQTENPVEEIIRRSNDYDQIILPITERNLFERAYLRKTVLRIARESNVPLALVRSREPEILFEMQHFVESFRDLE